MSRIAPRIHTDPAQIARLEALLPQLDGETQVELTLLDGRRLLGTVAVRPTVQQHHGWWDEIASIRRLPPRV